MVRAKFFVRSVELHAEPVGSGSVKLAPVYKYQEGIAGNACIENQTFWTATPSGEISMYIANPPAFKVFVDAFNAKKAFYVDFQECDL